MKLPVQNRTLTLAIGLSVLLHGALLAVRFTAPDRFQLKPADPGLEVILVNAKHDKKPLKADALAQANLDGGGNAESGRATSPLPDMQKSEDGTSLKEVRRRIEELEQSQQRMLAQMKTRTPFASPAKPDAIAPREANIRPDGADADENEKAIARREAEIAKNIEDYNKRPKKTQITPSTQEVGYAMYYKNLQTRVENIGTLNFPQKDGKKLYGELVVYIPILHDGTIYTREGGARVERKSGNPALDAAALRIVQRSAPFGRFPANMRTSGKDDVWEVITRFRFTREENLQTELRGASN